MPTQVQNEQPSDAGPHGGHARTCSAPEAARGALRTPTHLAVIAGPDTGWVAGLDGRGVVVGRGNEADLRLVDDLISRRHLRVRHRAGSVQVRDLDSANGTRWRPARGMAARTSRRTRKTRAPSSEPLRWRHRPRKVGRRWQRVAAGDLLHLGASTLQIRSHPSLHTPAPPAPAPGTNSLLPRLAFPLLMSAGMIPVLATSQVGLWRLLLMILMPLGLLVTVAWPTLAQRRRQRDQSSHALDPDSDSSGDGSVAGVSAPDPAALILAVQAGPTHRRTRWDIGTGDVTIPGPPWGRRMLARSAARSAHATSVAVPARGTGLALVGDDLGVDSLARYLVCQVASSGAAAWTVILPPTWTSARGSYPQDSATPRSTTSDNITSESTAPENRAPEDTAPECLRVLDVRGQARMPASGQDGGSNRDHPGTGPDDITRADPLATHLVLARHVGQVPPWCTRIIEVRSGHDRQVSPEWARTVGELLREAGSAAATIPSVVPLTALLGPGGDTRVRQRWQDAGEGLAADIGTSLHGTVQLDLVRDGPHAVVAGTTGSGKSELLLSWVLSLAARYPPGDLAFLLVDYKGGATFAPVVSLPHVLGVLTDLDAATTSRALDSLRAELHRRERILARAGVANLADYRATTRPAESGGDRSGASEPLPRLMVLVDEFRVMSDAHPEHLDALVRLAAQGRSLGIHLVLSTQRPAGAISADMRANLTTRLCLRVLEEADSADTIGIAAAATLPAIPGRAILRTESTVTFQSAWCGDAETVRALVSQIRTAATGLLTEEPWRRDLPPPWAPPLPERLSLTDLPEPGPLDAPGHVRNHALPWLRTDHPDEQRLGVGTLGLPSRLLISGPPGSGRSTAGATIAAAALRTGTPVHTLSATALTPSGAPARGTSCLEGEVRRAHRLLGLLSGRQERSVVIIDDADAWAAALDEVTAPGAGQDMLSNLLRQSRRSGMAVVITAGSSAHRWAAQVDEHLVLAPHDAAAAVMAGVPRELIGSGWPPGRGVLLGGRQAVVCHVATPPRDDASSWPTPPEPPVRIAALPDVVRWADMPSPTDNTTFLWLGVGGDSAQWVGANLPPGGTLLVTGAAGTGRSSALALIRHQVQIQGRQDVLVIDDADRLDAAALAQIGSDLRGRYRSVVAAAHPDRLLSAYHELGSRLREAGTVLALSPVSTHLTGVAVRSAFDPGGGAGQGALVDGARVVPLRLALPPAAASGDPPSEHCVGPATALGGGSGGGRQYPDQDHQGQGHGGNGGPPWRAAQPACPDGQQEQLPGDDGAASPPAPLP